MQTLCSGCGLVWGFFSPNLGNWNNLFYESSRKRKYSRGLWRNKMEKDWLSTTQSWSLTAPFYRNNSKKKEWQEEMAVEKHLLQNYQNCVLFRCLPVGLGLLHILLGLLGRMFHGLVGCHWWLSVHTCKMQTLEWGRRWVAARTHLTGALLAWRKPTLTWTCR